MERLFYLNPRPGLSTSQMARLVRIWPHGDTNSIFVLVPPDQIPIAKNLIGMLDVKPEDAVENAQIQLFKLKHTEAEAVGEILESMVEQVLSLNPKSKINSRQIRDLVEIWPNLETNSLFVLVPKEQLPMVTNLLTMLDIKPERVPRQIHYVLLENADAVIVTDQITQLFSELDDAKQPIIQADLFTNSITLIATSDQITEIDEMIASLDEAAIDKTLQIRVISSEGVPARDLAETLTGFYSKLSGVNIKLVDELPGINDDDQINQKDSTEEEGVIYIAVDLSLIHI